MSEWEDFFEFLKILLCLCVIIFFACVAIAVSIFAYNYTVDRPQCERFSSMSGNPTQWSMASGCLVKYRGEWVRYDVAVGHKQDITVKEAK